MRYGPEAMSADVNVLQHVEASDLAAQTRNQRGELPESLRSPGRIGLSETLPQCNVDERSRRKSVC